MEQLLDNPQFIEQSYHLIEHYRQNPEIAAYDLLLIDLSPVQRVILRDMWFKNYVISIMGRGSGKCVGKDTYLFTTSGIKRINELVPKVEILKETSLSISNGFSLYPSTHVYYDDIQPVSCLRTRCGYNINITDEHPLLVMAASGNLEWRKGCDLKIGDYVSLSRGQEVWGNNTFEPDLAYYLGLLTGDGCLSRKNIITFTNEDDELLNSFCSLTSKYLNYSAKVATPKKRSREVRIYSIPIRALLFEKFGLKYCKAPGKELPSCLRSANREAIVAFLQGLFDTDGWVEAAGVGYCTSSRELAHIVHLLLLNFGVISHLRYKPNAKSGAFIIDIHSTNLKVFHEKIGFRLNRKASQLASLLLGRKFNPNIDIIPNQKDRMGRLFTATSKKVERQYRHRLRKYYAYYDITYQGLDYLLPHLPAEQEDTKALQFLSKSHLFFDAIEEKTIVAEEVYDLCMPEQSGHSFVGNGFINHNTFLLAVLACLKALLNPGHRIGLLAPTFRQSKYIFDECDKIWQRSPILQEATERKPTTASDNCYMRFKSYGGRNASIIQAIPLGDGSKIRGSRFYTIVCDEFPHIPPDIFNMVIRPMGATSSNPMERVRHLERQRKLLEKGLITEADIEKDKESTNQIIITSSGYFTFNHMYSLYCAYKKEMLDGNPKYAAFRVPYNLLPEGFLDLENVESSRKQMSNLEFRMEYGAEFIPDTDAFYKASLLDICSRTSFSPQVVGSPGKRYCLSVDPARSEDSFAITVVELDRPAKIVHAIELQKIPFPQMSSIIEQLCVDFNVEHIYMDSQGGGWAIKDLLAENRSNDSRGPILDPEDEVHQFKTGRHILKMCDPSVNFISESNFAALRLLEHRDLLFPSVPTDFEPTPAQDESWQTILKMKSQMQTIELTETPTGKHHFDVPKGEGHGKQKKDLYTAFMLAARCVYDSLWSEQLPESILHQGGFINSREAPNFSSDPSSGRNNASIPQALRDKLDIIRDPEAFKKRMFEQQVSKRTNLISSAAVLKPKPKKKG